MEHTHEDEEDSSALHLYCHLFVQHGTWFVLDDLYGRYYAAARVGVGHGRSDADANADADADEEGEARESRERGDLGEEE